MTMNCHEFRTQLSSVVESRETNSDERQRLHKHSQQCTDAECRRLWADDELLAAILPGWRRAVPQVSLSGRVVAELRKSSPSDGPSRGDIKPVRLEVQPSAFHSATCRTRDRSARKWLACAAAVAALLLLVSLFRTGGHSPTEPLAGSTSPQNALVVQSDEQWLETEGPAAVSEVIRTYAAVPQTATEFVTGTMVLFLPADRSEPSDPATSRRAGWTARLSEQIEPWGRDLGIVLDAFLDSVADPPDSCRHESGARPSRLLAV
ncbi:MAG: hypothetical protein AB7U20_23635 [Planctomycetaceae bacterium]